MRNYFIYKGVVVFRNVDNPSALRYSARTENCIRLSADTQKGIKLLIKEELNK